MEDHGPYQIVVHGKVTRTAYTLNEARRAAQDEKHQNPNKHVSIRDRFGVSTPEDFL